jgi:23S rRNA-/tRNA-specific pseudouridylate synthase
MDPYIIFEDDDMFAIGKPPGMLVQVSSHETVNRETYKQIYRDYVDIKHKITKEQEIIIGLKSQIRDYKHTKVYTEMDETVSKLKKVKSGLKELQKSLKYDTLTGNFNVDIHNIHPGGLNKISKQGDVSLQHWLTSEPIFDKYVTVNDVTKDYGICNRLDRDTSGIVIVAKFDHVFDKIRENINSTNTKKIYIALINGKLTETREINNTIEPKEVHINEKIKYMGKVTSDQPKHHSIFAPLYHYKKDRYVYTLVMVRIITGTRNQVRVHANYMGMPVVSDSVYCDLFDKNLYLQNLEFCDRLFLHSTLYVINKQSIFCDLWPDLKRSLMRLNKINL